MPSCPIYTTEVLSSPCARTECHNNVPTLDYHCLSLHCSIYDKRETEVLQILYGKPYQMMVALSIKAMRVAYVLKNLDQKPKRKMGDFERAWIEKLLSGGPLDPVLHWIDIIKQNANFKFIDRMAQVLNTMDIQEYSLPDILKSYKNIFSKIDLAALAIHENDEDEVKALLEGV